MDGQRFDQMTKAMAGGASRRRALRLAGGAATGALLAAVGVSRRAGAQAGRPCNGLRARCAEQAREACGHLSPTSLAYHDCLGTQEGTCTAYLQQCHVYCGGHFGTVAGACEGGCPAHEHCVVAVNPGGNFMCRCVNVD